MRKILIVATSLAMAIAAFGEPTVSDVRARQRYPWNGLVDIDYTINNDARDYILTFDARDVCGGKDYQMTRFLSVPSVTEGRHRVTWSTQAEGVHIISTNVVIVASLKKTDPITPIADLYYVIDLSGGSTAERYPVSVLTKVPDGGWSNEYKTSKLVLRRIEAGTDPLSAYRITQPYYIGVFELTRYQWYQVMGTGAGYDSYYYGYTDPDARPAAFANEEYGYPVIRGTTLGASRPLTSDVDPTSFMGILRKRTGLDFDLPTEAQWEYACRAGTTSSYNNGGNTESDLMTVARYFGNVNDGRGGYADATTVGSYQPNAWGLYDMHGNVWELCRDWWGADAPKGDDPTGADSHSMDYHVMRGGSFYDYYKNKDIGELASGFRNNGHWPYVYGGQCGFRLYCPSGL